MLIFIPKIYDDEILYSVISRYHFLSGNRNLKATIREFFDYDSVVPTIGFPSLLENLATKIPKDLYYDSNFFIDQCTLFPIYIPFLPEDRKAKIITEMKNNKGTRLFNLLGIQAGHILEINKLKYCPLCAIEDYKKYDEIYYHRIHQVEGVFVCNKHGCLLKEYVPNRYASRLEFVRFDYDKLDLKANYTMDNELGKWCEKIAKSYEFLLSNDLYRYNNDLIHNKYIKYLDGMGLVTPSKRIKQRELTDKFINYYGVKVLDNLNCSFDLKSESSWLKNITRKQKMIIHPLRHILFIIFLCSSVEEFFNKELEYCPFGESPWPCLNPAAEHYLSSTIKECIISSDYKTRAPVGTFKCSCGFIYSRKGPDTDFVDRYRIGRIKNFGHIWEQKLYNLVISDKYTIRELSELMKCDPATIKKYANKLCCSDKLNTDLILKEEKNDKSLAADYRQDLVNFIINNPNLSRTELRKCLYKQYIWLYRHDKDWLMENLPSKVSKREIDYKASMRVNWGERDIKISSDIEKEYEKIISSEKLVRVTKSLIGIRTGYSSLLYNYIDKLPKTSELLNEICETVEEFQIRRLKLVAEQLYEDKGVLRKWEVIRVAGIRKDFELRLNPIIDIIIDEFN